MTNKGIGKRIKEIIESLIGGEGEILEAEREKKDPKANEKRGEKGERTRGERRREDEMEEW